MTSSRGEEAPSRGRGVSIRHDATPAERPVAAGAGGTSGGRRDAALAPC
ncbi:hypothetical protein EYF80_065968 [Liparis tanakae]|uniref:Uncharacterized protein n=1 Tax=Liparis tanakae TaxID=230148 RepID=A0A4Z2E569_9TELE|nr:hypothetical protein EYF80_065968 [Liparis tanakae]